VQGVAPKDLRGLVDEVMIKLSVKERKAHVRMLLRAEKVLAR